MMAGLGGDDPRADGGPARHIPVLLHEVIAALQPGPGMTIVDGTFGAGGYTRAILHSGASVLAIDRDPNAVHAGQALVTASGGRLTLVQDRFSRLDEIAGESAADGVVLDVGVSSMQLDEAERGFSFRQDGPLDMRMDGSGVTAAEVVNSMRPGDLARIFGLLGEERHAGRVARMIERRRKERPFLRTKDLADAIEALLGRRPGDPIHPATRSFQGLRIFVNNELGELARALFAAELALKPGGRLAVVTFHSLEDRIVKRFLAARSASAGGSRHMPETVPGPGTFRALTKGVVQPSDQEIEANPRARSAKLRAAVRTEAPAAAEDLSALGLPAVALSPGTQRR